MLMRYPKNKLSIIGAGIIGALEAYAAYLEAKKRNEQVRITMYEKNEKLSDTTTGHIVPSLTIDEALSVVPRGKELIKKLLQIFSELGGIRVDDVPGVNGTDIANQFIKSVEQYGLDEEGHKNRTKIMLELGKMSMDLWQRIYDEGDPELKKIMEESNFNPCREPKSNQPILHDGYRIDLIYGINNAKEKAHQMQSDYTALGYKNCQLLSPHEVMERDPYLKDFCLKQSHLTDGGEREWNSDAVALWRPGGCIDTQVFLPKFYDYLHKVMGTYINEAGEEKDCLQIRYNRKVVEIKTEPKNDKLILNGLKFFNSDRVKQNKHLYDKSNYVFCSGEAVGTLSRLNCAEPAYARFAGASLMLNIPIPLEKIEQLKAFNHCMEVHSDGVVLAWQARFKDNQIFVGVAGTKAFYSDQEPHKDQEFAKNRNLLQLNMINDVLPEIISMALGRDTKGIKLTWDDLQYLEEKGIATRWVGSRAVAYDGFPTFDLLHQNNKEIINARTTKDLSSGGVSLGPIAVSVSRSIWAEEKVDEPKDPLIEKAKEYGRSTRTPF